MSPLHVPVDVTALPKREVRVRDLSRITLRGAGTVVILPGDEVSLRRLSANVIDNAWRYGTRAEISVAVADQWLSIDIEDDGPGIPHEEHDAVLEPFYRIESSRNRATGGSEHHKFATRGCARSDDVSSQVDRSRDHRISECWLIAVCRVACIAKG
jgi:light-regulated signal transduction histidine kinase (bacteriophytochrome)